MRFYRPTFAEIDLGAIRYNIRKIRDIVGRDINILGIVKADAYGHGMKEVSRAIIEEGVEYLGVASLDEARELRDAGIKSRIIVLGSILPEEAEGVLRFNVVQTVSDLAIAKTFSRLAGKRNRIIKVHAKIDTGMGRIGVWHKDAIHFVKELTRLRNIEVEGIFTHFPSAEDDKGFTRGQLRDFKVLIEELWRCDIDIPLKHTSNSAALVDLKEAHMNMVRPGLIMYGLYPRSNLIKRLGLKPVLSLKTKVVYVKSVSKGRSISYGRTYITKKDTNIATIPVGYGDGYSRHLSNNTDVLIRGKRVPLVGRVCMDMSMLDVGSLASVKVGDEAVLIGRQGKEMIRVEELARAMNTIPYEVVCNIGRRVPRVYLNK